MPEPPDISESKENRSRFKTDFYAAIHHDFGSVTYDYVAGDDLARMDNIAPDGGYFFTRITDKKNKTLLLPAVLQPARPLYVPFLPYGVPVLPAGVFSPQHGRHSCTPVL